MSNRHIFLVKQKLDQSSYVFFSDSRKITWNSIMFNWILQVANNWFIWNINVASKKNLIRKKEVFWIE